MAGAAQGRATKRNHPRDQPCQPVTEPSPAQLIISTALLSRSSVNVLTVLSVSCPAAPLPLARVRAVARAGWDAGPAPPRGTPLPVSGACPAMARVPQSDAGIDENGSAPVCHKGRRTRISIGRAAGESPPSIIP